MNEKSEPPGQPLILLVDDVPENIQVLHHILQKENYSFAITTNGQETLTLLKTQIPDLILLDIMLPGMDGFEVCEKIKSNPDHQEIPIIFLTAKIQLDDKIRAFKLGAVDYITKPFEDLEVIARVRNHIELKLVKDRQNRLIDELQTALNKVKELEGLIPICASCKKIRNDEGYWEHVETYISQFVDVQFSHSICQDCARKLYPNLKDFS